MTELYLIRHARQISASENALLVLADHDDGSTEIGHTQAKRLARQLATKIKPAVLYTSPLVRAYQTAEHISRATDLPINVEPALVELRLNCPPAAAPDLEIAALGLNSWDLIYANDTYHLNGL